MNCAPNSTARRKTATALARSLGGPQMPSPVKRIAPKPRRFTVTSLPSKTCPAWLAESSFLFMVSPPISFLQILLMQLLTIEAIHRRATVLHQLRPICRRPRRQRNQLDQERLWETRSRSPRLGAATAPEDIVFKLSCYGAISTSQNAMRSLVDAFVPLSSWSEKQTFPGTRGQ